MAGTSLGLIGGLLFSVFAFADNNAGCLNTDYLSGPITWSLPSTPESPNWVINSTGQTVDGFPPAPVSVPFSATFWRRPECPTQLILTLDVSDSVQLLGSWSAFQNGVATPFLDMIVNDPAVYGLNDLVLFGPNVPPAAISGVVRFPALASIDPSKALLVDFTPQTFSGAGSVVSVQIPAATTTIPPPFTIGPGMTGQWFDVNQNGHGFGVEVLPGNQMLAEWFVFAPQGGPTWILATGPINGSTAVLTAIQSAGSGGRFPPDFDETQVQNVPWGTITFTFVDCNNGTASWQPTTAGYTSGSIPITRLTLPAGLTCP